MNTLWQQMKNVYHYFQAQAWRLIYRWPDKKLEIYGITGTNGKTTTAIVLGNILRQAHDKEKIGLLSTEVFWLGKKDRLNKTHMTSTDAKVVYKLLNEMVKNKVEYVVLEMTSHALHQHRLAGIKLSGAILLNITREHLDYHLTMLEYAKAKAKIVNYLKHGAKLIANKDDDWIPKVITSDKAIWFTSDQKKQVKTKLPGNFNKENVLAAKLLAKEIGIASSAISDGIADVAEIPGRMNFINLPSGARALVDFALTPDALEQLYKYLKETTPGKIFAVFGAAGRRDREKRPVITDIASRYVDELVITQDEPYDEDEEQIYQELEGGLLDQDFKWQRIEDRKEAIAYALKQAGAGDVVAVTGMGNYMTRAVGDKKIPWNDKQVVEEIITEMNE